MLAFGANLINGFIVKRQAIAARFDNAVHLLFQLRIKFGQTAAHFAAFAHLLNDNFIQRNTGFFDAAFRAFINPRQRAA
ncbi:Uncharacterised protein [Shigella sonnei]|nr:Uncharacterised protein [Shigella sonnei]